MDSRPDEKLFAVTYPTATEPQVSIQVIAIDGQLLLEKVTFGDKTLIDFDLIKIE